MSNSARPGRTTIPRTRTGASRPRSPSSRTADGATPGRRAGAGPETNEAPRRCLSCGTTFQSAHRGNRICGPCKGRRSDEGILLDEEYRVVRP